ncbi:hypothetical protein HB364_03700 [Pseudoflavitalea sp. X16]|uniref:tetratricopeptide repeat protein n=1 Tax=Paraflavitalea devenefica TaxID=2716334 RepID=UPI0014213D64|nr:hypothetical protein [Paraflavitalea devenefica]NII24165.1 hypothetical protein [Paraflavitalea devenefica]
MEEIQTPSTAACANCNSPAVVEGYPTPLCQECRQQFIKYPIPLWIKIFAGAIGVVVVFALFSFPKNLSLGLQLEKGVKAAKQHKYLTAQRELTAFTKANPGHTEAQGYLTLAAFYNGDYQTFADVGQKLVGQSIDNSRLLSDLNWIGERFEEYYPSDSLKLLVEAYTGDHKAVPDTAYQRYLQHHSQEVYALFSYASSLYDQDQYTACDSVLALILAKDESYLPALRMRAGVQRELGNWDASVKNCDLILDINKEAAYAIASKARTCLKQHKDKEGLQLALESVKMDKDDGYCACTLALAYHFNGQITERDAQMRIMQSAGNAGMKEYAQYALDIISKKEPFRN